jgi:hypothetical protein
VAGGVINNIIRAVIQESGVIQKCGPRITDAIIAVSSFLPVRDGMLVKVLLAENGIMNLSG